MTIHMLSALLAPTTFHFGETQLWRAAVAAGHARALARHGYHWTRPLTRLVMGGRTSILVAMVGVMGAVAIGGLLAVSCR